MKTENLQIIKNNYDCLKEDLKQIFSFDDYLKIDKFRKIEKIKIYINKFENEYLKSGNKIYSTIKFYDTFQTDNFLEEILSEFSKEEIKEFVNRYEYNDDLSIEIFPREI